MPRSNPYDRRDRNRPREGYDRLAEYASSDRPMMVGSSPMEVLPGPHRLHVQDLDAAAASAYARGMQDAQEQAARYYNAEAERARREVWEEGYEGGRSDGETETLMRAGGYEQRVRDCAERARNILLDPGLTPTPPVAAALDACATLLEELTHAHHRGFRDAEPDKINPTVEF